MVVGPEKHEYQIPKVTEIPTKRSPNDGDNFGYEQTMEEVEKTPEGAFSNSLRLNTLDYTLFEPFSSSHENDYLQMPPRPPECTELKDCSCGKHDV